MKGLTLSATLLALAAITPASHAATVTIGNITIEQVNPFKPGTFDNNKVGDKAGFSKAVTSAGLTTIGFATDGAVATGSAAGVNAEPAGDKTNYLWGFRGANGLSTNPFKFGATVLFLTNDMKDGVLVNWFYIYWGSIDAITGDGYDNTLTLSNGDSVNGSQLAAAAFNPLVNGQGDQKDANDNEWFKISDKTAFFGFNAFSSRHAFEFDMAVPEPSTWVMMGLGFAALGYGAFRRGAKASTATSL
jgi:hypothetical protein